MIILLFLGLFIVVQSTLRDLRTGRSPVPINLNDFPYSSYPKISKTGSPLSSLAGNILGKVWQSPFAFLTEQICGLVIKSFFSGMFTEEEEENYDFDLAFNEIYMRLDDIEENLDSLKELLTQVKADIIESLVLSSSDCGSLGREFDDLGNDIDKYQVYPDFCKYTGQLDDLEDFVDNVETSHEYFLSYFGRYMAAYQQQLLDVPGKSPHIMYDGAEYYWDRFSRYYVQAIALLLGFQTVCENDENSDYYDYKKDIDLMQDLIKDFRDHIESSLGGMWRFFETRDSEKQCDSPSKSHQLGWLYEETTGRSDKGTDDRRSIEDNWSCNPTDRGVSYSWSEPFYCGEGMCELDYTKTRKGRCPIYRGCVTAVDSIVDPMTGLFHFYSVMPAGKSNYNGGTVLGKYSMKLSSTGIKESKIPDKSKLYGGVQLYDVDDTGNIWWSLLYFENSDNLKKIQSFQGTTVKDTKNTGPSSNLFFLKCSTAVDDIDRNFVGGSCIVSDSPQKKWYKVDSAGKLVADTSDRVKTISDLYVGKTGCVTNDPELFFFYDQNKIEVRNSLLKVIYEDDLDWGGDKKDWDFCKVLRPEKYENSKYLRLLLFTAFNRKTGDLKVIEFEYDYRKDSEVLLAYTTIKGRIGYETNVKKTKCFSSGMLISVSHDTGNWFGIRRQMFYYLHSMNLGKDCVGEIKWNEPLTEFKVEETSVPYKPPFRFST